MEPRVTYEVRVKWFEGPSTSVYGQYNTAEQALHVAGEIRSYYAQAASIVAVHRDEEGKIEEI